MGLYVNRETPGMYKEEDGKIKTQNQGIFRENYLKIILKEQQELNRQLTESASKAAEQTEVYSRGLFDQIALQESLVQNMNQMADSASKTAENNEVYIQGLLDQIAFQESLLQKMNRKLEDYEATSAALLAELKDHEQMKAAIEKHIDLQDVYHRTLMERFDDQAASQNQTDRKLDHLKSSLFERAAHLSEKIDDQFKNLASFLLSLFVKPKSKQKMSLNELDIKKKVL